MAKVVGPLHSSEARGSVGSLTYNTWRGISIVKARVGPAKQYEAAQVAIRTKAALATASWQGLTNAQRDAWYDYANAHVDVDWTGNPQRITAYNWYIRANVRAQLLMEPIREEPPTAVVDDGLTDLITIPGPAYIIITWNYHPSPPQDFLYVEIYGTGPHSPGRHPTIKQCHRVKHAFADALSTAWSELDPGLYTIFIRSIHAQGVTSPWAKTTGTAQ